MSLLLMCAGENAYAMDVAHIKEIIPRVLIVKTSSQSDDLLGHIIFDGKPVPIADLSYLINRRSSQECMHSRIILMENTEGCLFGLLAERVTEMIEVDLTAFDRTNLLPQKLPFLNGIAKLGETAVQLLDPEKLISFFAERR